jgi:hypothetical protein
MGGAMLISLLSNNHHHKNLILKNPYNKISNHEN